MGAGPSVEAELCYCVDTGVKPVTATTGPGGRLRERTGGRDAWHRVRIHDARAVTPLPSLDREGFALLHHETAAADLWDEDVRRTVYDPEVEALIARICGADRVVVFDHTLRSADVQVQADRLARQPVYVVHNDYTERSAPQRVRDVLPAHEVEDALRRRFALIQIWRPIGRPALADPLGLCDARTLGRDDLIAAERRHPNRVGEIYQVAYSPRHRWYYFPSMAPNEIVMFKVFDSATDGRARFTAHTAFADPTAAPDAPPRESIEVRALALFA